MFEVGKKYRYQYDQLGKIEFEVTFVQDNLIVFRYITHTELPEKAGKTDSFHADSAMAENSKEIFSDIDQKDNVLTISRASDGYAKERILRLEAIEFVPDITERAVSLSLRINNPGGSYEEIKFGLSHEDRSAIKDFLERFPY